MHQRTANVIRHDPLSEFAGEGLRRAARSMLPMIYKLGMGAERSWHRMRGFR